MSTELQEQFKNYVFEDVKANIDEWYYRNFRDKIIELRRAFAKENGLKNVTQVCPKLSDLKYPVTQFREEYVENETARLYEEYKPLAIAKVVNAERIIEKINELVFYEDSAGFVFYDVYSALRCSIDQHYNEIRHTLSNPAGCVCPCFDRLANEILKSLFTVSLAFKCGDTEQIKKVA